MNTITVPKSPLIWSLFSLRLSISVVFILWTLNKILNPDSTAKTFEAFYGFSAMSEALSFILGGIQALIVICFLVGFKKRLSIGAILIMHVISTLVSYERYLDPFTSPNLLFFAGWPMLAGLLTLYLLRDYDTKFSIERGVMT
ncbi:hypothetical protein PsAD26_04787 [Pseudovibrio sp. Ad26]|nr:hypothetical protein PsAD26_04787 [Pseudovibrio sp. Ad26]